MPLYEYQCQTCLEVWEEPRQIRLRDETGVCPVCASEGLRCVSAPSVDVWNKSRRFPNLSAEGDGTRSFESKAEYEAHLKKLNLIEATQGGKVETPHGSEVVEKGGDSGPLVDQRRGLW